MKYLRFKLKILLYGIRVNFSLKKELKSNFSLSCFVKLTQGLRFVQEIKIIFKYRDCLKVLSDL